MRGTAAISEALGRIVEQGGSHNFVILEADERKNYFVQFAGSRGEAIVRAEAVSNLYLEPSDILSPRQTKALLAMGWHRPKPGQSPNFYRDWDARDVKTRRQMAREAMRTLVAIYGLEPGEAVRLELHLDKPDAGEPNAAPPSGQAGAEMPTKVLGRPRARVDH